MSGAGVESWTVLGDDQVPIEPVERFLGYLSSIERSPNTVRAYAHDLKDWFTFLGRQGLDWRSATVEDVAGFVAWLRLPPAAREARVQVLPTVDHHCAALSVNRKLAALDSFCEFHARHGVPLGGLLITMAAPGRGRSSASLFKPFLHHIAKSDPQRRRTITLPSAQARPRVLTAAEAQAILDACEHLRDRFLFAVLLNTGEDARSINVFGCGGGCSKRDGRSLLVHRSPSAARRRFGLQRLQASRPRSTLPMCPTTPQAS